MVIDPFSASEDVLRYESKESRFVLYSVGPDRIDDDGKPMKLNANPQQGD